MTAATVDIGRRWYPLRVIEPYLRLTNSTARFDVIEAGRRSGKTELVKRMGVEEALEMSGLLGARWYTKYCAPTLRQARDIYWDDLCDLTRSCWRKDPNKTDLCIYLEGGAELWVCGLDRPQRIEGSPTNRLVVDELADVKDGAWDRNLRPVLDTEMPGYPMARAWLLGVPRPGGQFAKLAKLAKDPTEPDYAYHTWTSERVLDPAKIASAKRTMDPRIYAQEYLAQRVAADGRAYYAFAETNLREVTYDQRLPLLFCFDFNRSPGVAVVAQEQAIAGLTVANCPLCDESEPGVTGAACKRCRNLLPLATCSCAVGEVHIQTGSNTPMVATKLIGDWGHHKGEIYVYGDPAGGAKTTTAVDGSDWDLLRSYFARPFPQAVFDIDRAHPPVRARVNAMNLRACNASGERRMFTNPTAAPNLTRDLQEQMVVAGGSGELEKEKDKTIGHAADGWGYAIEKLYPAEFGPGPTIEAY